MYGFKLSVYSRLVSLLILLVVVTTTAAPPCNAAGLSVSYYFLQARPPSDLFGVGAYWEEPDGDGWMFSLLPAVRGPFLLGDDGSTQVYLQGGVGWYHIDINVIYTGSIPGSD